MHIPDGFLSTPIWAGLDLSAVPATALIARRAQRGFDEAQVPLLGVLGAFVFAAQMVNFPVGPGTTGHLVGGALLSFTLGPLAASVVMTAILVIQALVFQDGGVLALGANIWNMAIFGVLAGYLPYYLWSGTKARKLAIFAGGALSVLVSAFLALSELLLSGLRMTGAAIGLSLALFVVSALLEGAISLAVVTALENIQPGAIRRPQSGRQPVLVTVMAAAALLASVGVLFAANAPDGIERLTGYHTLAEQQGPLGKAGAGLGGLALIYGACLLFGRAVRNRSV